MDLWTTFLIALGLAMDAFAVSITSGFAIKVLQVRHLVRIALFFGSFQAIMPVLGWLAGLHLRKWISRIDHWLAFGLLVFIGGKMILEATYLASSRKNPDPLKIFILLGLAVATSIDALAVGLSFSFLNILIATPAIIIGMVTFGLSLAGVAIGHRFGTLFENKLEITGGLILIAIGIKILLEHLLK